jgi:uncharacterized protein YjiS (DUF1127 family)
MSAILALATAAATPVARALAAFGGRATRALGKLAVRLKNRRDALRLASLDDRMLADIGLTRSDLRDAYAESLWRDPTDVLARRSAERRLSRRRPGVAEDSAPQPAQPPAPQSWCRPAAGQAAHCNA